MRIKNFLFPLACMLFAFCLEVPLSSSAMNTKVMKGDVSLVEQKEEIQIHASDGSIMDYKHFNVDEDQEVKIVQPSRGSILVIRVNSDQPTRIKSKISANGIVYLINPKGIFLDKSASLESGTFYLVGAELLTDPEHKVINIKQTCGDIVNHGHIESQGEIHLMGRHIVNSGTITAVEKVKMSHTNAKNQLSILHTGRIESKEIVIEAQDGTVEIYGHLVSKNAIEQQYGGRISVLGQHIHLIGAYVDASGTFRGGQVNLGGGREGNLFKAKRTSVDSTTVIDASAIEYGSGGEVVVWSKELTSFQGEIYAKGGRKYGPGGRVETSSLNQLGIFSGKVNVGAVCGEEGLWLLHASKTPAKNLEESR